MPIGRRPEIQRIWHTADPVEKVVLYAAFDACWPRRSCTRSSPSPAAWLPEAFRGWLADMLAATLLPERVAS